MRWQIIHEVLAKARSQVRGILGRNADIVPLKFQLNGRCICAFLNAFDPRLAVFQHDTHMLSGFIRIALGQLCDLVVVICCIEIGQPEQSQIVFDLSNRVEARIPRWERLSCRFQLRASYTTEKASRTTRRIWQAFNWEDVQRRGKKLFLSTLATTWFL